MATDLARIDLHLQRDWAMLFTPAHDWRRRLFDPRLIVVSGVQRIHLRQIVGPDELSGGGGIAQALYLALQGERWSASRLRRVEEIPGVAASREAFWRAAPDYLAGMLWENLMTCVATDADEYLACWQRDNHPLGFDDHGRLILVCAPTY